MNKEEFSHKIFGNYYDVKEDLGSGQFAIVRRVVSRSTSEEFAAKFIRKRRYTPSRRGVSRVHIEREVDVLRQVGGHENVISLLEVFETPTEVILVLELVTGGELFDHICTKKSLDEVEAAAFVRQILQGIKHLHSKCICHFDLKQPENVMLKRRGHTQIKIIDFGLSRRVSFGSPTKDMMGTPEFVAPEIVNFEALSPATDMWALGVIAYILLSGGSPFLGATRDETFGNITAGRFHFDDSYFGSISALAKNFIGHLLVKDTRKRATVDDCLQHPWIMGPDLEALDLRKSSEINIAHIHAFRIHRKWKQAYRMIVVCNRITREARKRYFIMEKRTDACQLVNPSTRFNPHNLVLSATLIACEVGNLDGLDDLETKHLHVVDENGDTTAHVSAGAGRLDILKHLQMKGVRLHDRNERGETPLFAAARNRHSLTVCYLCSQGVDVNVRNELGESPLHVTARLAQIDSLSVLLGNGADVNVQDENGDTVLHIASWHGYTMALDIMCKSEPQLLLQNQNGETALHCASIRGHLECVRTLITNGAPIDAQDRNGYTAIHLAVQQSHVEISLFLLSRGCRSDLRDSHGDTALHTACRVGLLSVVQLMCHMDTLVDVLNTDHLSPLHIAAKEGYLEIVRCLCLTGCDIAVENKNGLTPEIMAFVQEHAQVGDFLARLKNDEVRAAYIDQLSSTETPLRRIKLKFLGHSMVGKTQLVQTLQTGVFGSLINAVSRRFSLESASSTKDDGLLDITESPNTWQKSTLQYVPVHCNYTHGIEVQTMIIPGAGEYSVWDFGGYPAYHVVYDHFIGNSDCIHVVVFRACDPTEVQYEQVLYWMNFLKGRVLLCEPIGHCGLMSRRSKVILVGTHASSSLFSRNIDGDYLSSDCEAMVDTIRLRFRTCFDVHERPILLDATQSTCTGLRSFKQCIVVAKQAILTRLPRSLGLLHATLSYLNMLRKQYGHMPVISLSRFVALLRQDVNCLLCDSHCRQLVQQLQLIGEVVYLRDEDSDTDYVVLSPDWLSSDILGLLLSAEHLARCPVDGRFPPHDLVHLYPELTHPTDLLHILITLQLCSPPSPPDCDYEFPVFNVLESPADVWREVVDPNRPPLIYGGVRILPTRDMERSLTSGIFPRIQTALRRSMRDFHDPMDADLTQWRNCSKLNNGRMEALVGLVDDGVQLQVRGPPDLAVTCFFFLEELIVLVEQTIGDSAPGIGLERHWLCPVDLAEHRRFPVVYSPSAVLNMQLLELSIVENVQGERRSFAQLVCFDSIHTASSLILGVDISIRRLPLRVRCELAVLLDPADSLGRDWSILAVRLDLTDQLPDVDSTGQALSRTDQLLTQWALRQPEKATVGCLGRILADLGRDDAVETLCRLAQLYICPRAEFDAADKNCTIEIAPHYSRHQFLDE